MPTAHMDEALLARSPPLPDPVRERTGGQILIQALIRNGVEVVFGLPGGSVIPLYDHLLTYATRIKHVLVRHEQAAVHAADAYARVSGKPGVAIATSGPGSTNLLTGLMNAHLDSVPLVVVGGQVPTTQIGTDAFQECDMMGLSHPITKHNLQPRHVDELDAAVERAFIIARSGRPGPVYIDAPKDVLTATTDKCANRRRFPMGQRASPSLDPHAMARAVVLTRGASRPLLLLGQGAVCADATEPLGALAHALQIPVATTVLAKGAFDERDPLCVGCIGMHGRRVANYAASHCDVLIAFGCRFSDRATGEPKAFAAGKQIVHVDIDSAEIGKNVPVGVGLHCDAKEAAQALLDAAGDMRPEWLEWTGRIKRLHEICDRCVSPEPSRGLVGRSVMEALNSVLEADDIVTTGVGQHQMFATHYLRRRRPRTFITSGGAGTMGFGLPSAIGAALAKPRTKVWLVDGDGSFQMTLQELATLRQQRAPVVILVLDNGYLGMVRQWQELFYDKRYSAVDLAGNPSFVKIAEAYGIEGIFVDDRKSLQRALRTARHTDDSLLIHVALEKESNVLPMVPAGGGLHDFFGNCIQRPGRFFTAEEMALPRQTVR